MLKLDLTIGQMLEILDTEAVGVCPYLETQGESLHGFS